MTEKDTSVDIKYNIDKVLETTLVNDNDCDDILDEQYDDINIKSSASVNIINTDINTQTKNVQNEMDSMFPGFDMNKINEIKNILKGMSKHKVPKYLSKIMKQADLGVENILPEEKGRRPREDIKTRLRRKLQEKREKN